MKEVTGEANMTIVAIILIGVLAAAATIIINGMMDEVGKQTGIEVNTEEPEGFGN